MTRFALFLCGVVLAFATDACGIYGSEFAQIALGIAAAAFLLFGALGMIDTAMMAGHE